jgi:uncharacterized protein (TIGR04222 family)
MYGPYFLAFYAATSVLAILLLNRVLVWMEPGAGSAPPLPREMDPYEVAMLESGPREMANVALFSLQHRGWIDAERGPERTLLFRTAHPPEGDTLHPVEEAVLRKLATPMDAEEVRDGWKLLDAVEPAAAPYRARLERAGLLVWPELRARQRTVRRAVSAGLVALAAYKVGVALYNGFTNVWLLLVMACFVWLIAWKDDARGRLTPRGKTYLGRIRLAFWGMRQNLPGPAPDSGPRTGQEAALVVALAGAGSLVGTPWLRVPEIAPPPRPPVTADAGASASSSSSSSSSSDSSSSSSDGGGSSCGSSCGGGGCGGCGS